MTINYKHINLAGLYDELLTSRIEQGYPKINDHDKTYSQKKLTFMK